MDSRRQVDPSRLWRVIDYHNTGSSADNIVSHFAVNYHNEAAKLGIDLNELYSALLADGELNPPEWNTQGRQVNVYK